MKCQEGNTLGSPQTAELFHNQQFVSFKPGRLSAVSQGLLNRLSSSKVNTTTKTKATFKFITEIIIFYHLASSDGQNHQRDFTAAAQLPLLRRFPHTNCTDGLTLDHLTQGLLNSIALTPPLRLTGENTQSHMGELPTGHHAAIQSGRER